MIDWIRPTYRSVTRFRCIPLIITLVCGPAGAAEIYNNGSTSVRWDNTLRYTMAFRLTPRNPAALTDPNQDDGDRNFAPGLISNRLDILSVFDVTREDSGFHISGVAWYDTVYHTHTDNHSPATYNAFSVPNTQYPRPTRNLHGQYAGLEDAYFYANLDLGGIPLSLRAGRQTLLWGESLFFAENSIAAGQSPIDNLSDLSAPSSYSKAIFLPVTQVALSIEARPNLSINAYYQFEWRKDRRPAVGSYFSYYDSFDTGGERLIVAPGEYFYRIRDKHPSSGGQFGISLRTSFDDIDFGLYAMRFNANTPEISLRPGRNPDPAIGKVGEYQLFYPSGIELYGLSFSTYAGDSTIAGEFSARRHMPLASLPPSSEALSPGSGAGSAAGVASGDTLQGQISSVTQFGPQDFWNSAELSVEVAANYRLNITANKQAIDSSRDRFALSFRGLFEPHYFQVLPNLDLSIPISLGYNAIGRSSIDEEQYFGSGDLEVGVAAIYRSIWRASLTVTTYLGSDSRQPFSDRDFLLLSVERTF